MDTQGGNEVLAGVAHEAKRTAGTASAHGKDVGTVGLGPGAAISVLPDGLLNDAEERVGVGLVDLNGDGVRHCRAFCSANW